MPTSQFTLQEVYRRLHEREGPPDLRNWEVFVQAPPVTCTVAAYIPANEPEEASP